MTDQPGVRLRTAAETSLPYDPVVTVGWGGAPLRMTNATVGTGPLGGVVVERGGEAAGVLAQRHLLVDGEPADLTVEDLGGGRARVSDGDVQWTAVLGPVQAVVAGGARRREVVVDGFRFLVDAEDERVAALRERASRGRVASAHAGPLQVRAIIPGKVVAVSVAAGDAVAAGQQLLVVEAMKMQNELRAPRDGTIERVDVTVGAHIEVGDPLVVIS